MARAERSAGALTRLRLRAWTRRARRLLARGRSAEAVAWCQMALELDRTWAPARELAEEIRAGALRQAAQDAECDATPAEAIEAASWCVEAGAGDLAWRHARRAARGWVRSGAKLPPAELLLVRGEASYLVGAHERALKDLTQAARLGGEGGFVGLEATYYSALASLALGRRSAALEAFRRVVRRTPWLAADRLETYLEQAGRRPGADQTPPAARRASRAVAP